MSVLLILLGALGFVVSGSGRLWDAWIDSEVATPVGVVSPHDEFVRHRRASSLTWRNIHDETKVSEGDSVFTGPQGTGELKLYGQNSVELMPNTLVVIRTREAPEGGAGWLDSVFKAAAARNKRQVIEVNSGQIRVSARDKSNPIEVKSGNRIFQVVGDADQDEVTVAVKPRKKDREAERELAEARPSPAVVAELEAQFGGEGIPKVLAKKMAEDAARFVARGMAKEAAKKLLLARAKEALKELDVAKSMAKPFSGTGATEDEEDADIVVSGGKQVQLPQGQAPSPSPSPANVSAKDVKKDREPAGAFPRGFVPVMPGAGATLTIAPQTEAENKEGVATELRWKWPDGTRPRDGQAYTLVLEGPSAENLAEKPADSSATVKLREGAYRWKMMADAAPGGGARAETSEAKFQVRALRAPQWLLPIDGEHCDAGSDGKCEARFSWEPSAFAPQVELEILPRSESDKDKAHLIEKKSEAGKLGVPLAPGEYSWRARRLAADGKSSAWSAARKLKVLPSRMPAALPSPQPSATPSPAPSPTPSPKASFSPSPSPKPPVKKELNRKKASVDEDAKIKISDAFKPKAKVEPKAGAPVPGPSQVRESAEMITEEGGAGVLDTALSGHKSADDVYLDRVDVFLNWKSIPKSESYLLKVWRRDGTRIGDYPVTKPGYHLSVTDVQNFNLDYQVTANLPHGEHVRSRKTPVKINFAPPVLSDPVFDESADHDVFLTWQRTILADRYQIQISSDPNFSHVVDDELTASNLLTFRSPPTGKYYWRVRSKAGNEISKWSSTGIFEAGDRRPASN